MSSNRLRLNTEKTQFTWLCSSHMMAKTKRKPLRVGGVDILPLDARVMLFVTLASYTSQLDSNLTMKTLVRSCCCHVLHWLPVEQRITYKIAMITFSCVRCTCLAYFSDICTPVQTVARRANLRSARHGHLIVPATKTKTFGSRSLRSAAPTLWNSLPANLLDNNI